MTDENNSRTHVLKLSENEVKSLRNLVDTLSSYDAVESILFKAKYKEWNYTYYEFPYAEIMIYVIYKKGERVDECIKNWINEAKQKIEFKWYIPTNNIRFCRENIDNYENLENSTSSEYLDNVIFSNVLYDKTGLFTEIQNKYNGTFIETMQDCIISNVDEITHVCVRNR